MNGFNIISYGKVPAGVGGPVTCAYCACVFEYPLDARKKCPDLDGELGCYMVQCPMPGCPARVVTSYHGLYGLSVPGDAWVKGKGWTEKDLYVRDVIEEEKEEEDVIAEKEECKNQ